MSKEQREPTESHTNVKKSGIPNTKLHEILSEHELRDSQIIHIMDFHRQILGKHHWSMSNTRQYKFTTVL